MKIQFDLLENVQNIPMDRLFREIRKQHPRDFDICYSFVYHMYEKQSITIEPVPLDWALDTAYTLRYQG